MQQSLVLLVPHAELLQEQMSVPDDLLHLHVVLQTDRQTDRLCSGETSFGLKHFFRDIV